MRDDAGILTAAISYRNRLLKSSEQRALAQTERLAELEACLDYYAGGGDDGGAYARIKLER